MYGDIGQILFLFLEIFMYIRYIENNPMRIAKNLC